MEHAHKALLKVPREQEGDAPLRPGSLERFVVDHVTGIDMEARHADLNLSS